MAPASDSAPPRRDHWEDLVRNWNFLGAPLRPSPEDIAVSEESLGQIPTRPGSSLRALILGVTPELAACRWPAGTKLLAIDRSRPMIEALWPAPGTPAGARAICGDWCAMPLGSGETDFVAGDGCYVTLPFPDRALALGAEVHRILVPDGIFVIRVFVRPDRAEPVDAIASDLEAGKIGNVHAMKWRLAHAIHGTTEAGVRLADIWETWQTLLPLARKHGARPGWRPAEIATLDAYKGVETRYHFPTVADFRALVSPHFDERRVAFGRYELGERCPIFVLAKRMA